MILDVAAEIAGRLELRPGRDGGGALRRAPCRWCGRWRLESASRSASALSTRAEKAAWSWLFPDRGPVAHAGENLGRMVGARRPALAMQPAGHVHETAEIAAEQQVRSRSGDVARSSPSTMAFEIAGYLTQKDAADAPNSMSAQRPGSPSRSPAAAVTDWCSLAPARPAIRCHHCWRGGAPSRPPTSRPCASSRAPRTVPPRDPHPSEAELAALVLTAPMMAGAEYLTQDVLRSLWRETAAAFATSLTAAKTDLQSFLKALNPAWNLVGRVHFNLAENRRDDGAPFAFLATYTTQLSAQARAQHMPLGQARREYAGAANRQKLLALLLPVQRAAETCAWLRPMVDEGEIYHPLRWTPGEAARLLTSVPDLERAGVMVRMPPSWRANRPPRPKVTGDRRRPQAVSPGAGGRARLPDGRHAGRRDTDREGDRARCCPAPTALVLLRGQWVEVDRERLERSHRPVPRSRDTGGARRPQLRRGHADVAGGRGRRRAGRRGRRGLVASNRRPVAGGNAARLRAPNGTAPTPDPRAARRPAALPARGLHWLQSAVRLGLGACLADDMGLGKTIQVLALLLASAGAARPPSLLVAPASLLANWAAEVERFAPDLRVADRAPLGDDRRGRSKTLLPGRRRGSTSCHHLRHAAAHAGAGASRDWRLVVLDEAQAIKNPGAKQTRAVKKLKAAPRIALTGTPVENRLGDLWSIFDFLYPGLLGSAKQFSRFAKALADRERSRLRPAARPGAALHPAAAEDRQARHRRPARQDRGEGVLRPDQAAGGALRAGGRRSWRERARRRDGHRSAAAGAGATDAAQADLQPSLAVAAATAPGPRRTAASSRGCARSPRRSPRGRRRCWSSRSSAR